MNRGKRVLVDGETGRLGEGENQRSEGGGQRSVIDAKNELR
jgi:hypothetical protein